MLTPQSRIPRTFPALLPLILFTLLALLSQPAARAADEPDPLQLTAQKIADQITSSPTIDPALYAPAFLKAVPVDQMTTLSKKLAETNGPVKSLALLARTTPFSGKFVFHFAEVDMPVTLALEPEGPAHRIAGLWFGITSPRIKTWEEFTQKLAKLPGKTGFQLLRLEDKDTKVLASLEPDRPLAIGSTFKLFLLAALVSEGLEWERIVRLDDRYRSLPSGEMQNWPEDAPVTVHTMTLKMISQSDNTATDHLLALMGRGKVERIMAESGVKKPEANVPMLSTMEMFKLKADAELRKKYLAANVDGRVAILEKLLATPAPKAEQFALNKPIAIDTLEWFASPADLCRTMAWLETKSDQKALAILGMNPGITMPAGKFAYVGYKGGSEPGVISMSWLLWAKDGQRYAMSATWNDTENEVDLEKFIGLMQAAMELIGTEK